MRFSKRFKVIGSFIMCLFMTNLPNLAVANSGMIPTTTFVEQIDRAKEQEKIQEYLTRGDVQKILIENGVAPAEVSNRIASLSDTELRQLAGQVEQARAGGDILIAILVVVLIIFLIKRI